MSGYVGRLAPSPTGRLHLGHAFAFHWAAERARVAKGRLLLRMDDLDRQRAKPEYARAILDDLAWLGIGWEPPVVAQSERVPLYRAALEHLLATGNAYACTCSRRDVLHSVDAPHDADDEPIYPGRCRESGSRVFAEGVNFRMRVREGEVITFRDGNLGLQQFVGGSDFGDFLLWRKDGVPAYQLATVVDDAAMGVTEVVRGRDLLKSAARQILVARALGLPSPAWFHVALVRDEEGARLAKRTGALSLATLRAQGVSAEEALRMAFLAAPK